MLFTFHSWWPSWSSWLGIAIICHWLHIVLCGDAWLCELVIEFTQTRVIYLQMEYKVGILESLCVWMCAHVCDRYCECMRCMMDFDFASAIMGFTHTCTHKHRLEILCLHLH